MAKHLNITVNGRVQGVGFRRAARDKARYLGIKGIVKNLNNGIVYIEAEGEDTALAMFVQWCRQGPPFSVVDSVQTNPDEWVGYISFDAQY